MPNVMTSAANGRVLWFVVSDPLTLDELFQHTPYIQQLMDRADYRIHTCIDVTRFRQLPYGIMRRSNIPAFTHARAGMMIMVGADVLIKSLTKVAAQMYSFEQLRFCDSDAEAWEHLNAAITRDLAARTG